MAYLLGLVLLFISSISNAYVPSYSYSLSAPSNTAPSSSVSLACQNSYYIPYNYKVTSFTTPDPNIQGSGFQCTLTKQDGSGTTNFSDGIAIAKCADGSQPSGTPLNCTGNPPLDCSQGANINNTGSLASFSDAEDNANQGCYNGCKYYLVAQALSIGNTTNGVTTYTRKLGVTIPQDTTCSAATSVSQLEANKAIQAQNCASKGSTVAVINGVSLCVGINTPNAQPVKQNTSKTKTATDGSTTTSTINNVVNNDGTVTTTTITTNFNSSGAQVGSPTTEKSTTDKMNFCADNPNLQICKTSDFGGSCGSFSCSGDAIQCAISKEQHQRFCDLVDKHDDISNKGELISNGTDPNAALDPTKDSNITHMQIPSTLDASPHFSGSLADESVSMGHFGSITLPFSKLNIILSSAGYILLGFSYLAAARIIGIS